ncbi:MAG: hypothetical protein ABJF23_03140 [Bryobacteraceae bacterium]
MSTLHAGAADQIYLSGPETLAADALSIVAGPVAGYRTHVLSMSQGDAPIPLTWMATGRLESDYRLKGTPVTQGLTFLRNESSWEVPRYPNVEAWRLQYGNLAPDDQVVLFLTGDPASPTIDAVCSGHCENKSGGIAVRNNSDSSDRGRSRADRSVAAVRIGRGHR